MSETNFKVVMSIPDLGRDGDQEYQVALSSEMSLSEIFQKISVVAGEFPFAECVIHAVIEETNSWCLDLQEGTSFASYIQEQGLDKDKFYLQVVSSDSFAYQMYEANLGSDEETSRSEHSSDFDETDSSEIDEVEKKTDRDSSDNDEGDDKSPPAGGAGYAVPTSSVETAGASTSHETHGDVADVFHLLEKTNNIEELEKMKKKQYDKTLVEVKMFRSIQKKLKDLKKEVKKAEKKEASIAMKEDEKAKKKEEREMPFNIFVQIPNETEMKALQVNGSMTSGGLRALIGTTILRGMVKKDVKKMSLYLGENNITESPRKTLTSLGVVSDITVRVKFGGAGGGKSTGGKDMVIHKATKHEKIRMKEMEVKVLLNTLKGLQQPTHDESVNIIVNASKSTSPNMMKDAINLMSLESLRSIQTAMNTSNNESTRIDAITKAVYANVFNTMMEMNEFQRAMVDASRSTVQFAMMKTYATETGRLTWDSFREDLEKMIETKCMDIGRAMSSGQISS